MRLAASISLRRLEAVRELVAPFREAATRFSGADALSLAYAAQVEGDTQEERQAAYLALLDSKRDREVWQGTTLVGPHREDLAVSALGRVLPTFASRGEQRSAVLSLKLAIHQAKYMPAILTSRVVVPGRSDLRILVLNRVPEAEREVLLDLLVPDSGRAALQMSVLGVPVASTTLGGVDALLSIVQMPKGVPVGTLAIGKGGAANAALLAVSILAAKRPELREKLRAWRKKRADDVLKSDAEAQGK